MVFLTIGMPQLYPFNRYQKLRDLACMSPNGHLYRAPPSPPNKHQALPHSGIEIGDCIVRGQ